MKKLFFLAFIAFSTGAFAQVKLGHLNSSDLIAVLPGYKLAQDSLINYDKQIKDDYKVLLTELESKMGEYENMSKNPATSKTLLELKRKDVEGLQMRMQEFESLANEDIQNKKQELLKPLVDKINAAIEEVAKEGGYTYVFDSSVGVLLYAKDSEDISDKVKVKLKIATDPKPATDKPAPAKGGKK
jgi:outer membrane protein